MVDKVKPLKIESGSDTDFLPTETDPTEDYITSKGISLENSDNHLISLSASGELQYKDSVQASFKTFNSLGSDYDKILFDDASDILNDDEFNVLVED